MKQKWIEYFSFVFVKVSREKENRFSFVKFMFIVIVSLSCSFSFIVQISPFKKKKKTNDKNHVRFIKGHDVTSSQCVSPHWLRFCGTCNCCCFSRSHFAWFVVFSSHWLRLCDGHIIVVVQSTFIEQSAIEINWVWGLQFLTLSRVIIP